MKTYCSRKIIDEETVIVIGAGAGLSTADGLDFGGKRFRKYMVKFGESTVVAVGDNEYGQCDV